MYQFSRAIYRELATDIAVTRTADEQHAHEFVLRACEATMDRLAHDRHYFARPSRSLFNDVRVLFPMATQLRVFRTIERHMTIAAQFVDAREREGISLDGSPLCCHASTRKGTACQRVPLPGSKYCPSHKHLEETFESAEIPDSAVETLDSELGSLATA